MDLLSALDLSKKQINDIFVLADSLKHQKYFDLRDRKVLALLFEKPSTRTRVSFEAAIDHINGSAVYIDLRSSQLSRGESIADTAKVLSLYVDFIAARLYSHKDLEELARFSSVPVINALTDLEHPCQALSDVYTIREALGSVKGRKVAFVGDIAANTCNSLMIVATKMGAEMSLVGPSGCRPNTAYVRQAQKHGRVSVTSSIRNGLSGADIVYTDTFVSMGQEKEGKKRRRLFKGYIVNEKMLSYAKKSCRVMHCLPAHRGEEISASVLDGKKSIVWQQARNKLLIEKTLLIYLSRN